MRACWIVMLGLGLIMAAAGPREPAADPAKAGVRMMLGDDQSWSVPGLDDHNWQRNLPGAVPLHTGPFWVRCHLELSADSGSTPVGQVSWWRNRFSGPADTLVFSTAFPFELYWDGRLLERSGIVGSDRASEVLGPVDHLVRIPDDLRGPGRHVVALRMSSHHFTTAPADAELPVRLERYASRLVSETWRPVLPLVGMGCSLFLAAVCVVMLEFSERRRPLRLSIALCVTLAVYCGVVAMRGIYNLPYNWVVIGFRISTVLLALLSGLVPWLLAEQFRVPKRRWWIGLIAVVVVAESILIPVYDVRELWLSRTMLCASLGIAGWAAWMRRPCAWAVVGGVFLRLFVITPKESVFTEPAAFVIAGGMVLFICRTLAAQGRSDRERVRSATLNAARLEVELLKKNIQPHFLMNTLATIVEVIQEEPRTAVTLIEALASEFRILARVSGEKLIPLGQELELCHSHLRIMSIRRSLRCSLEAAGVDEAAAVPPGLFHTLIEGGLSHQMPSAGELKFVLEGDYPGGVARYMLTVHGEAPTARVAPVDGTGLRYVKARLEESFAGRWTFNAGPVADGWRTLIEIRPPCQSEVLA